VNTYSSSTDNLLAINCGNSCTVTTLPVDKYHTCKLFDENRASGCMDDCAGVGANDLAAVNTVLNHCGLGTHPLILFAPRHSPLINDRGSDGGVHMVSQRRLEMARALSPSRRLSWWWPHWPLWCSTCKHETLQLLMVHSISCTLFVDASCVPCMRPRPRPASVDTPHRIYSSPMLSDALRHSVAGCHVAAP
jgi:hypothetical protein